MSYSVRDSISKRVLISGYLTKASAVRMAQGKASRDPDSRFEVVDDAGRVLYVTAPRRVSR